MSVTKELSNLSLKLQRAWTAIIAHPHLTGSDLMDLIVAVPELRGVAWEYALSRDDMREYVARSIICSQGAHAVSDRALKHVVAIYFLDFGKPSCHVLMTLLYYKEDEIQEGAWLALQDHPELNGSHLRKVIESFPDYREEAAEIMLWNDEPDLGELLCVIKHVPECRVKAWETIVAEELEPDHNDFLFMVSDCPELRVRAARRLLKTGWYISHVMELVPELRRTAAMEILRRAEDVNDHVVFARPDLVLARVGELFPDLLERSSRITEVRATSNRERADLLSAAKAAGGRRT